MKPRCYLHHCNTSQCAPCWCVCQKEKCLVIWVIFCLNISRGSSSSSSDSHDNDETPMMMMLMFWCSQWHQNYGTGTSQQIKRNQKKNLMFKWISENSAQILENQKKMSKVTWNLFTSVCTKEWIHCIFHCAAHTVSSFISNCKYTILKNVAWRLTWQIVIFLNGTTTSNLLRCGHFFFLLLEIVAYHQFRMRHFKQQGKKWTKREKKKLSGGVSWIFFSCAVRERG